MLRPVALVQVGHHLIAAIRRKVDIDVGRRVMAVAQKTLEQQVVAQRVHRRDAQHVRHQ